MVGGLFFCWEEILILNFEIANFTQLIHGANVVKYPHLSMFCMLFYAENDLFRITHTYIQLKNVHIITPYGHAPDRVTIVTVLQFKNDTQIRKRQSYLQFKM